MGNVDLSWKWDELVGFKMGNNQKRALIINVKLDPESDCKAEKVEFYPKAVFHLHQSQASQ